MNMFARFLLAAVLGAAVFGGAASALAAGQMPLAPTVAAGANQEGEGGEEEGPHAAATPQGESQDTEKVVWTLSGIGAAAILFGVFYLFKRRVGAFPANPSWVAPITILRAGDLPDEGDFGPTEAHDHGAAGHAPGH